MIDSFFTYIYTYVYISIRYVNQLERFVSNAPKPQPLSFNFENVSVRGVAIWCGQSRCRRGWRWGLSFCWPRHLEMKYIQNIETKNSREAWHLVYHEFAYNIWIASNFGEVILGSSESRRQVTGRQHDSICPLKVFIIGPKIVLCSMKFHTLSWDVKKLYICIYPRQGKDTYPILRKGTSISSSIPQGWGHVCSRRVAGPQLPTPWW